MMRTIADCIHALNGACGTAYLVGIERKVAADIVRQLERLRKIDAAMMVEHSMAGHIGMGEFCPICLASPKT